MAPAQQHSVARAAPHSTRTRTEHDDSFRISDPRDCGSRSVWIRSGISVALRRAAVGSPSDVAVLGATQEREGRGEVHGGERR
jgi:hypothetical protein